MDERFALHAANVIADRASAQRDFDVRDEDETINSVTLLPLALEQPGQ
jgi:hypothetical protein